MWRVDFFFKINKRASPFNRDMRVVSLCVLNEETYLTKTRLYLKTLQPILPLEGAFWTVQECKCLNVFNLPWIFTHGFFPGKNNIPNV